MAIPVSHDDGRARGDDDPGFDEFYRTYATRLRGFVGRRVADEMLVHDIVQETLLRAYAKRLHHQETGDPWRWLAVVARRLAIDASRSAGRALPVADVPMIEATEGADEVSLLRARGRGLNEVLRALPDRPRRLLLAHHLEGASYRELASREGLTLDAVRCALHRARRVAREHYVMVAERRGLSSVLAPLWAPITRATQELRRRLSPPSAQRAAGDLWAAAPGVIQGAATVLALSAVAATGGFLASPGAAGAQPVAEIAPASATVGGIDSHGPPPPVSGRAGDEPTVDVGFDGDGASVGARAATPAPAPASPAPRPAHMDPLDGEGSVVDGGPAQAEVGGDFEWSEHETGRQSYSAKVIDVRVDANADGEHSEDEVVVAAGAGYTCPPPDERRGTTAVVCPVLLEEPMAAPAPAP